MSKLSENTLNLFAAYLDAYAEQLSGIAAELTALHQDMAAFRKTMCDAAPRQIPTHELEKAA